jgi:uncharacterized membrane protein
MIPLGELGPQPNSSLARSASFAGDVIVGTVSSYPIVAFVWTPTEGMVPAPITAYAVSGNGAVIGGSYGSTGAAIWSASTGRVDLGYLPGHTGQPATRVLSLSYDGSVAVGEAGVENGTRPFRWDQAHGMQTLQPLFGAGETRANAVSADGRTVVGVHSEDGAGGFRLTDAGVFIFSIYGNAKAVSADGWVIVGAGSPTFGSFVWDPVHGFRDIEQMLLAAGINAVEPYRLTSAMGVSADGSVIVGNANGPDGMPHPWIVHIPSFCYANCDGSTATPALNVLDFNCFLNKFTAGMGGDAASLVYANCNNDEGLNVLDFNCFVNKFVQGCP